MIRILEIPGAFDASAALESLLPLLPPWRMHKALSYRKDIDRFLCTKSFLILESMLRDRFAIDCCPEFSYGYHGKPFFCEYPDIFFNISHCHTGIACAVMDKPVGIDIEEIQFDRDVAKAILDKDEYAAVCKSEEPDVEFTKLWTLKESYLKLTGEGIRDKMKDVLTEADAIAFTTVVNRSAGYVYSTALFKQAGRSITITN